MPRLLRVLDRSGGARIPRGAQGRQTVFLRRQRQRKQDGREIERSDTNCRHQIAGAPACGVDDRGENRAHQSPHQAAAGHGDAGGDSRGGIEPVVDNGRDQHGSQNAPRRAADHIQGVKDPDIRRDAHRRRRGHQHDGPQQDDPLEVVLPDNPTVEHPRHRIGKVSDGQRQSRITAPDSEFRRHRGEKHARDIGHHAQRGGGHPAHGDEYQQILPFDLSHILTLPALLRRGAPGQNSREPGTCPIFHKYIITDARRQVKSFSHCGKHLPRIRSGGPVSKEALDKPRRNGAK